MEDSHHNENRQIIQDLVDNATNDVSNVLVCYNYDTDGKTIQKKMNKHSKKELSAAATYLKQIPTKLKREELRDAIISRIDNLLLEECRKCKEFYSVDREDIPTASCSNCGQGAHESCYKDLAITLNDYPGIQYLCSRCEYPNKLSSDSNLNSAEEEETPASDNTHHTESDDFQERLEEESLQPTHQRLAHAHPSRDDAQAQINNFNTPIHLRVRTDEEVNREGGRDYNTNNTNFDEDYEGDWRGDYTRPTCEKLRRGVCPHGISGRTLVNGQECFYTHPKRCMPFCRNGTNSRDGCNRGRDCDRLHPILCKFSVRHRCCYNLKCKFTHLKMTRRYRTREQSDEQEEQHTRRSDRNPQHEDNRDYSHQQRNDNERSDMHQRNTMTPLATTNQLPNETASFLAKLPELFKQMQQELKEVKHIQQTRQYPPAMPWYTTVVKPATNHPQTANHPLATNHPLASNHPLAANQPQTANQFQQLNHILNPPQAPTMSQPQFHQQVPTQL